MGQGGPIVNINPEREVLFSNKNQNMITKVWNWLVYSSTNADKYSTTIKGFATFIPTIIVLIGLLHLPIHVTADSANGIIDQIVIIITALASIVSGIMTVVGAIRKIFRTTQGTNDVVVRGMSF